jgi:Zn-dependent protease
MKWSWKLGRFAGIDSYVHASFLLLVVWAAWAAYQGAGTGLAAVLGVVFLAGVFGSVLLHELGHAIVARRYGIQTRRIVLLPIGGIAQLEGEPRTPKQELAIALAGPAVNFAIAAALFVLGSIFGMGGLGFGLLGSLMIANISLGLFNLIPAFPMDGGRALRALLTTRVGSRRATEISVKVAKVASAGFMVIGLFTNWTLALIGLFVWFAAGAEARRPMPAYARGYADYRPHRAADRGVRVPTSSREVVNAPWWAWRDESEIRPVADPYRRPSPSSARPTSGPPSAFRRVIVYFVR